MKQVLLGAHVSIAGGLHHALYTAQSIGASTVQIFTANQRQWNTKPIDEEEIALFHQGLQQTGVSHVASHSSYLINLGSPKLDVRQKSIAAFAAEICRCQALGVSYLVFHPGAALDAPREDCLNAIVDALLSVQKEIGNSLRLLLETTAGQGSVVGSTFEELAYIIERTSAKIPIGVCLDTCHVFAAGYDLRTEAALQETLQEFDDVIGLQFLYAMHLNDSSGDFESRIDRHSPIGEGCIGKNGFSAIMREPRLLHVPKYLETPGGLEVWQQEIEWLKKQVR
jgi:deoxyribonuclease-4